MTKKLTIDAGWRHSDAKEDAYIMGKYAYTGDIAFWKLWKVMTKKTPALSKAQEQAKRLTRRYPNKEFKAVGDAEDPMFFVVIGRLKSLKPKIKRNRRK